MLDVLNSSAGRLCVFQTKKNYTGVDEFYYYLVETFYDGLKKIFVSNLVDICWTPIQSMHYEIDL